MCTTEQMLAFYVILVTLKLDGESLRLPFV